MNIVTTTLTNEAFFSDDGLKRYLLRKTWDADKPSLAVIMLAPSIATEIAMDTTTQLVLNNACRLGYGSVAIVNLFATLNDFSLKQATSEDSENMEVILQAAQIADRIVYASGVGKAKSKVFQQRQDQVLKALRPFEEKLFCLCDEEGKSRLQHPLSPAVRTWHLSPFKVDELLPTAKKVEAEPPKKGRGRPAKAKPAD